MTRQERTALESQLEAFERDTAERRLRLLKQLTRPSEPDAPAAALATETESNQQRLSPSENQILRAALTDITHYHEGYATAMELRGIARKALGSLQEENQK